MISERNLPLGKCAAARRSESPLGTWGEPLQQALFAKTTTYLYNGHMIYMMVFNHLEKYESQWEGWHPRYWNRKCTYTASRHMCSSAHKEDGYIQIFYVEYWTLCFLKALQKSILVNCGPHFQVCFVWQVCDGQLSPLLKIYIYIYCMYLSLYDFQAFGGWKCDRGKAQLHARILRGKDVQKKKPNCILQTKCPLPGK